MTAAEFVIKELGVAKEVKEKNPDASLNKLRTLTGQGINQLRIKVLADEGYGSAEISKYTGIAESVIRRILSKIA